MASAPPRMQAGRPGVTKYSCRSAAMVQHAQQGKLAYSRAAHLRSLPFFCCRQHVHQGSKRTTQHITQQQPTCGFFTVR